MKGIVSVVVRWKLMVKGEGQSCEKHISKWAISTFYIQPRTIDLHERNLWSDIGGRQLVDGIGGGLESKPGVILMQLNWVNQIMKYVGGTRFLRKRLIFGMGFVPEPTWRYEISKWARWLERFFQIVGNDFCKSRKNWKRGLSNFASWGDRMLMSDMAH